MNINHIEELYRHSDNKYKELYNYFYNYSDFEILITPLSLGFNTVRIRDYNHISEIKNKDDLKYPPTSKSFSRIGKPDQIWFYLSDDIKASFAEMLPAWFYNKKLGETIKIIVSHWHIRQKIRVVIIPDLLNINEVCKHLDLSGFKKQIPFWNFICQKYRTSTLEDQNIYQFTSAFANSLVDRSNIEGNGIDGIFYPSVQFPIKSNIALKPSVVDSEKIILSSLGRMKVRKGCITDYNGLPNYETACEFEQGYYEPNKDLISWN